MERDFVGYGKNPPKVAWPGGARVAISFLVAYEEGSEYSLLDGDPHREPTGDVASPVPLDQRDLINESFFEYGSRVGVWRLLELFDRHQMKVSFFCSALALERNPEVAKEFILRGHEVAGHGYRWEESFKMDMEAERQAIHKAVAALTNLTGQRPLGWQNRYAPSVNTRSLLVEEGGFLYDSNSYNDDLPYFTPVNGQRWLVLPYTFDVNDARAYRAGGFSHQDFYETMKDNFDCLYEEGRTTPKMMSVGLHCRISGRPGRSQALERFIQYAQGFSDVWFARRVDIARWWLEHHA